MYPHGNTTMATIISDVFQPRNKSEKRTCTCTCTCQCAGGHHLEHCHKFRAQTLQQRRELVTKRGVCHSCLNPRYYMKKCRGARICGIEGCQRRLQPLFHSSSEPVCTAESGAHAADLVAEVRPGNDATSVSAMSSVASSASSCRVGLQVVPVRVSTPYGGRVIETYAFLDSGSNVTMCLNSLAEELGAECSPAEFTLSTVTSSQSRKGQQLCLEVVGVNTDNGVRLEKVWTTNTLPVIQRSIPTTKDVHDWPHLKGVDIADLVMTCRKPCAPSKCDLERSASHKLCEPYWDGP